MVSQAKIRANRQNAQKSTGPRTTHGKALASKNSLKHGLSANRNVIAPESQADYELYRNQILGELNPLTPIESMLADRVICLSWRLKRAVRIQNQAIDALLQRNASNPLAKLAQALQLKLPDRSKNAQTPYTFPFVPYKPPWRALCEILAHAGGSANPCPYFQAQNVVPCEKHFKIP